MHCALKLNKEQDVFLKCLSDFFIGEDICLWMNSGSDQEGLLSFQLCIGPESEKLLLNIL